MTRYRITNRRNVWNIDKFDPDTGKWATLDPKYDAPTAELAGRAVDAMVAMDALKKEVR